MHIKFEAVQLFDWEAEEYVGGNLCPLPSESRPLFNWKFVIVFNSLSKQLISACINPQLQMAKCARKGEQSWIGWMELIYISQIQELII